MTRYISSDIDVIEATGIPLRFMFKGKWRPVSEICDHWIEAGEWWDGEDEKEYFIIGTPFEGRYELRRDGPRDWTLLRILD